MYVKKIELNNYKGFSKTKVEFERDVNVFIGENAAGKTSFIEAILKSLYSVTENFVHVRNYDYLNKVKLNIEDIKHNCSDASILLDIEYSGKEFGLLNKISKFSSDKNDHELGQEYLNEKDEERHHLIRLIRNGLKGNLDSLPIIKFYPANRNSIKHLLDPIESHAEYPILESWSNIYQDENSFNKFFDWFFEHETAELRYQRDNKSFDRELPELKFVRMAVKEALKELSGLSYEIKSDQFKLNDNNRLYNTIKIETQKEGETVTDRLEYKSDGEKSIISLVADIAYNLSISNRGTQELNYLHSSGIVLIDEIGGHLHPKWQRKIIPVLRDIFPNIQFFITTHSPQVISSIESSKIFLMENFGISKVDFKTKGVDTNTLLYTVFDATERPQEVMKLIDTFDKKIEDNQDPDELEKIIDDIESMFDKDPGDANPDSLITELRIRLEAYKFDIENEVD